MGTQGFKDLKVWQRSKDLAVRIYKVSANGDLARDFGLRDQMRRATVSVCSNIAEGDERNSTGDAIRFFRIAKGSMAELITQLEIATEVGYLPAEVAATLCSECVIVNKMLGALIKARQNSS